MVEKLKKVIEELEISNKPFWMFAVLKMDEMVDKWSIIISAPWINDENRHTQFNLILDLLKKYLDEKELYSIGRISLLPREGHLIEELLKMNSGDIISNSPINGNTIHEGQVIISHSDLTWTEKNLFEKMATK
jgi:hypothetical protein